MTLPEILNYFWTEEEVIWFIEIVIAFFVIKQIFNFFFLKVANEEVSGMPRSIKFYIKI